MMTTTVMNTILTKPNLNLANVQIAAGIIQDAIHAAPKTKINIFILIVPDPGRMVGGFNRWRLLCSKRL